MESGCGKEEGKGGVVVVIDRVGEEAGGQRRKASEGEARREKQGRKCEGAGDHKRPS